LHLALLQSLTPSMGYSQRLRLARRPSYGVGGGKHLRAVPDLPRGTIQELGFLMVLTERDGQILSHVARYRLTTAEIVRKLFFAHAGAQAEKNVLRRLVGDYLQSSPLYARKVYYQLTPACARSLGVSEELATPFGPQALLRLYGVLAFCCLGERVWQALTRAEFLSAFPEFGQSLDLTQNHYYLDHDGNTARLGHIMIDQGGEYQRLIGKCRRFIERARDIPGLNEIVANDLLVISIIVGEETKAERLKGELRKAPLPVWCRISVVSELTQLMNKSTTSSE